MADPYVERQSRADASYLEAWKSLSPEARARVAAAGVNGPDCGDELESREITGRDHDVAVVLERVSGQSVDYAQNTDTLADELCEGFGVFTEQSVRLAAFMGKRLHDETTAQRSLLLGRIVGYFLLGSDNLQARAHGLAHAARMSQRNGLLSLRHSARVCGVSPFNELLPSVQVGLKLAAALGVTVEAKCASKMRAK